MCGPSAGCGRCSALGPQPPDGRRVDCCRTIVADGEPIARDPRDDCSTHRRLPASGAVCSSRPTVLGDRESGCSGRDRPCKAPDCCMSHRSVEVLPVAVATRIPSLTRSWRDGTRKLSQTGCRQRMHGLLGKVTIGRPLTSPAPSSHSQPGFRSRSTHRTGVGVERRETVPWTPSRTPHPSTGVLTYDAPAGVALNHPLQRD